MFSLSKVLSKGIKAMTYNLIAVLVDDDHNPIAIFDDGKGGPIVVTDDESVFDRIVVIFSELIS